MISTQANLDKDSLFFMPRQSDGECLAAKRTVKAEGRNLSACGAG